MNSRFSNDYLWLRQTMESLEQGDLDAIDHDRLGQFLGNMAQAHLAEAEQLTRSICDRLLQLPTNDGELSHQLQGHIIRDRGRLQQLLSHSPSLENHLKQALQEQQPVILRWQQVINPDFFGHN